MSGRTRSFRHCPYLVAGHIEVAAGGIAGLDRGLAADIEAAGVAVAATELAAGNAAAVRTVAVCIVPAAFQYPAVPPDNTRPRRLHVEVDCKPCFLSVSQPSSLYICCNQYSRKREITKSDEEEKQIAMRVK